VQTLATSQASTEYHRGDPQDGMESVNHLEMVADAPVPETGPDLPTGDQGVLLNRNQQGLWANQSPPGTVAE